MFTRSQKDVLAGRLSEARRLVQVVSGPRQVGKSTLVQQAVESAGCPFHSASPDEPTLCGRARIEQQWETARLKARGAGRQGVVLVLDEIQKIADWSETVKLLWDADTRTRTPPRRDRSNSSTGASAAGKWISSCDAGALSPPSK